MISVKNPPVFPVGGHEMLKAAQSDVQCCASCACWQQRKFGSNPSWLGNCRKSCPPTSRPDGSGEPDWPTPRFDEWCRQWEPRIEPSASGGKEGWYRAEHCYGNAITVQANSVLEAVQLIADAIKKQYKIDVKVGQIESDSEAVLHVAFDSTQIGTVRRVGIIP